MSHGADGAKCYLAYLTANDSRLYMADFLHFRNMARQHPGVDSVAIYIAISGVRPFDDNDRAAIAGLLQIAADCPWLDVRAVLWKGNVGRDFSSAEASLQELAPSARPEDWVMIRNRSGYGPLGTAWYRRYQEQYERLPGTGLVGSTIKLTGHPHIETPQPWCHIQTYVYLSRWQQLQPLAAEFPGARATERLDVIAQGEIGLSTRMLERGLGISCLHWPDELFTLERPNALHLPQHDIKEHVRGVPFHYKFRRYFAAPQNLPAQGRWWLRRPQQTAALRDEPRHLTLSAYGST